MNYCRIGEKIRKYRKAKGFSQEELAEKVGISVTHMSHIETGNTKLSLPVFVDLASVLEVQTDDLLYDDKSGRVLADILDSCSASQVKIILDTVKSIKVSMDKYL